MEPSRFNGYALALLMVGASIAGCRETQSSSQPDVMVAYEALVSAIAACGAEMATCSRGAEGDADALQTCREAFASCRQTAGQPATGALADAIRACTENAGECASTAGGQAAAECHDELVTCLGGNRPSPPQRDGGSGNNDGNEPSVAECIDTLLGCVEQDGSAMACAHDVRACIIAAVPAPDGVIPDDPGMPLDLPEPPVDAGMPDDLPEPPTDAGMAGDLPVSCMEQFEACVGAGSDRQMCARELRECGREAAP